MKGADNMTVDTLIRLLISNDIDRDIAFKVGGIAADYALDCYKKGYSNGYNHGYNEARDAYNEPYQPVIDAKDQEEG